MAWHNGQLGKRKSLLSKNNMAARLAELHLGKHQHLWHFEGGELTVTSSAYQYSGVKREAICTTAEVKYCGGTLRALYMDAVNKRGPEFLHDNVSD